MKIAEERPFIEFGATYATGRELSPAAWAFCDSLIDLAPASCDQGDLRVKEKT